MNHGGLQAQQSRDHQHRVLACSLIVVGQTNISDDEQYHLKTLRQLNERSYTTVSQLSYLSLLVPQVAYHQGYEFDKALHKAFVFHDLMQHFYEQSIRKAKNISALNTIVFQAISEYIAKEVHERGFFSF